VSSIEQYNSERLPNISKVFVEMTKIIQSEKMEKLFPGLWQVSYRDEYEDGVFKDKWRLKLSNTKENHFRKSVRGQK